MPIQYLMTYMDKKHWERWERLSESEKKKIKKDVQLYIYRKLDKKR